MIPSECEVIVVGAGVSGASAAYHLTQVGVRNIVVIDCDFGERKSGSAVMESAPTIKMMVQSYASSSESFIAHHGRDGARKYLTLTAMGLSLQKKLAKEVLSDPEEQLREMGSFYVAYTDDAAALRQEFETLQALGCCPNIEWYDKDMLKKVDGCSPDFHCAIFFPEDAIIDSASYAKGLLRAVEAEGSVKILLDTRVSKVIDDQEAAFVQLSTGERIKCKHVVMATGGLFQVPELSGILMPCYSYLVHVPVDQRAGRACEYSSNFFTWGFTHDWCFTKGKIRCSGEDHYSAYKAPLAQERCTSLWNWSLERYGCDITNDLDIPAQYGVYSETPDCVPLIGSRNENSNVYFLLGCNAWGQTVLSYASSLIPGLLGYTALTTEELDHLKLLSIRRFSELPILLSNL